MINALGIQSIRVQYFFLPCLLYCCTSDINPMWDFPFHSEMGFFCLVISRSIERYVCGGTWPCIILYMSLSLSLLHLELLRSIMYSDSYEGKAEKAQVIFHSARDPLFFSILPMNSEFPTVEGSGIRWRKILMHNFFPLSGKGTKRLWIKWAGSRMSYQSPCLSRDFFFFSLSLFTIQENIYPGQKDGI